MSTTIIELENKDIVVKMSGRGPIGPRGLQGEPGPAGASEWGVITGNISDQTDLQDALDAKADVGASYTKSEEDALLAQKANADSVYTKTETDALLADKADTDDVYSKTDVNTLLSGKADADTVYTKTETNTLLDAKADVGDSYTKAEEDALLAVKANSADVYTKTETDTLLADKADADDVYTKTEVDDALADKADSADVYTKDETDDMLLAKAPVILNSASGSIASFADGSPAPVTALTVSIEPVQDLHGYDNPWPAGGGKNLFNAANQNIRLSGFSQNGEVFTNTEIDSRTSFSFYIGLLNGNTTLQTIAKGVSSTGRTSLTLSIPSETTDILIKHNGNSKDFRIYYPFVASSGDITVSLNVSANNPSVLGGLVISDIQIESGSSATSYAPYSNICPISGHTSAVVTRTGKNLFDKNAVEVGRLSTTTGLIELDSTYVVSDYIPVKQGTSYYIPATSTARRWFYASDKTPTTYLNNFGNQVYSPEADGYIRVTITVSGSGSIDIDSYQIELGSSATSYEPYQAQQVTIDLDGTRYGGELNVLTGTMTVDRAIVDLGTLTWEKQTIDSDINFRTRIDDFKLIPDSELAKMVCSAYKTVTSYNITHSFVNGTIASRSPTVPGLRVCDHRYYESTAEEFKTAVSGVQCVYELATPFTVQLTPSQLSTLLGQNNVWADTGDVTVEYRADSKMYIDQSLQSQSNALKLMLTPNVETEMKASKNYTSGSIVIVNNDFIKLTSAVASGANLVIGSNCVKTTMAEWVASLTA